MTIDSITDVLLIIILPLIGGPILWALLKRLWQVIVRKTAAALRSALGITDISQKLDTLTEDVGSLKKEQARLGRGATKLRTRITNLEEAAASSSNPSSGDGSDES